MKKLLSNSFLQRVQEEKGKMTMAPKAPELLIKRPLRCSLKWLRPSRNLKVKLSLKTPPPISRKPVSVRVMLHNPGPLVNRQVDRVKNKILTNSWRRSEWSYLRILKKDLLRSSARVTKSSFGWQNRDRSVRDLPIFNPAFSHC